MLAQPDRERSCGRRHAPHVGRRHPNPDPDPDPNTHPNPSPNPNPNPNPNPETLTSTRFGDGTLRLVDVSSELPELRRRAGLSTWRVWYRAQWQASWDELQARFPRKCPPFESLFPPTADEAREMHLERCMRLLPHDNDGGAARPNVVPPPSAGPVLHGSCTHASSGDAWLRAA